MNARAVVLVVGAALLIAGVIGLLWPISATSAGSTNSVACGRALAPDDSKAKAADQQNVSNQGANVLNQIGNQIGVGPLGEPVPGQTNYVAACHSAIQSQQWWTIPMSVVGLLVIGGAFLVRGSRAPVR
jgi:hypothetical protein